MVVQIELLHHRAVTIGELVQFAMQGLGPEFVGQTLRLLEVIDQAEGVVQGAKLDVMLAHLPRQNAVAVQVEL